MKKSLLLGVLAVILTGCDGNPKPEIKNSFESDGSTRMSISEDCYDGIMYVYTPYYRHGGIAAKIDKETLKYIRCEEEEK